MAGCSQSDILMTSLLVDIRILGTDASKGIHFAAIKNEKGKLTPLELVNKIFIFIQYK